MDDSQSPWFLLSLVLVFCVIGSFFIGRKIERGYWKETLPEEMMKLCTECAGLTR